MDMERHKETIDELVDRTLAARVQGEPQRTLLNDPRIVFGRCAAERSGSGTSERCGSRRLLRPASLHSTRLRRAFMYLQLSGHQLAEV